MRASGARVWRALPRSVQGWLLTGLFGGGSLVVVWLASPLRTTHH